MPAVAFLFFRAFIAFVLEQLKKHRKEGIKEGHGQDSYRGHCQGLSHEVHALKRFFNNVLLLKYTMFHPSTPGSAKNILVKKKPSYMKRHNTFFCY